MNEVFIIMAFPHTGYGAPYVWSVFKSEEKAQKEMERITIEYRMERIGNTDSISTFEPSIKHRFSSFELCRFFVE